MMKLTKGNFIPCNVIQNNPESATGNDPPRGLPQGNKGFTIIEILITLLIFTISMIGIMSIRMVSLNGSFFTKDATVAASLGQKKVEELKNTAYSSISSGSALEKGMNIAWTVIPHSATVTDGETGVTYNFKDITVTISWKQKKIELYTIISQG
jgi:prepilin-type N-terminal cleavage/methylation domain-containing protein